MLPINFSKQSDCFFSAGNGFIGTIALFADWRMMLLLTMWLICCELFVFLGTSERRSNERSFLLSLMLCDLGFWGEF